MESGAERLRSTVQPFTKIEKLPTSKYKAPRLIQARHMTFNIEYGRYIKKIEEKLTQHPTYGVHFGKGDYDKIASKIWKLARKYPYYTELDHTEFDAHVTQEHLSLTHLFYQTVYRRNRELRDLSKKTLVNRCKTRDGDSWKIYGTRMSGDVDTSLGNCLINYAIIKELLHRLGLKGDAIVNGDDCIIFSNKPVDIKLALEILKEFNMESKIPKPSTRDIHTVEFCRTKLVIRQDGTPTMMIDPERVVRIFGMTYSLISHKHYLDYIREVAYCNSIINAGNPLGRAFSEVFGCQDWVKTVRAIYKLQKFKTKKMFEAMKHVDRNLVRTAIKQLDVGVSTQEITISMYTAWPDLDRWFSRLAKLPRKIAWNKFQPPKAQMELYIDHDAKKIGYLKWNYL